MHCNATLEFCVVSRAWHSLTEPLLRSLLLDWRVFFSHLVGIICDNMCGRCLPNVLAYYIARCSSYILLQINRSHIAVQLEYFTHVLVRQTEVKNLKYDRQQQFTKHTYYGTFIL